MQATTTFTVVDCPSCNTLFAITAQYEDRRREDGGDFYCPSGHSMSYGNSVRSQLKKERERAGRLAAQLDQTRANLDATERSRRAMKGQVTKIRNRVGRGVCPCCNRSFADLARHMETKHPDFTSHAASPDEGAREELSATSGTGS